MNATCEKFVSGGIDVSSEKLDVFLRSSSGKGIHKIFQNTERGISKMSHFMQTQQFHGKIVMESTGRYHGLCAVTLKEKGHLVSVINPLLLKKYQTAQIRKRKTDKFDAKLLAELAHKEENVPLFNMTREDLTVRNKISLMKSTEKSIQQMKATLKNYEDGLKKFDKELSPVEKLMFEQLKTLEKYKRALEKEIIENVFKDSCKDAQEAKSLLTSISGISEYLAALIYFFFSFEHGPKVSQWIAYTGMEVSVAESGKWQGKGRLSKRGNRYLRKRIFSAAWGALMNDESFKMYYDHLREGGRSYREALIIIGRKILRIAFSCLKNKKKFDPIEFRKWLKKNHKK